MPGGARQSDRDRGTRRHAHGAGRLRRVLKDVCLAYLPDVEPGEYVIVHVGFALQRLV
ncbi:hypothetical protein GCM10010420_15710 [Streptomyces glaucosporus]|uniref:Hydrogenase assembly chaperone hypC/hupF n=1 Tax=Streptomyces glaucosporus TaxID=284044 RepID=A0ABN3I0T9_9ACTN